MHPAAMKPESTSGALNLSCMNIQLFSKWGELSLADRYPEQLPGKVLLPGFDLRVAKCARSSYNYIFQQFDTPTITIRFYNMFSLEPDSVTILTDPGITFRFGVFHSHQFILKYLGKQLFHQRHYNVFFTPHGSADYPFDPGDIFIFLDLIVKPDYCLQLASDIPFFNSLLQDVAQKSASKLFIHNRVAPIEVLRWYEELEEWSYQVDKTTDTGEALSHQLIHHGLLDMQPDPDKRQVKLSKKEINLLYDAADITCNSKIDFTIKELARSLGISSYKLDVGFKQVFGHSILKHKFEEKMLIALRAVSNSRFNSKQVAEMLGYSDPQSFSRAFRNRFGYAPYRT